MNEARRLAYLRAMGVTQWVPRASSASANGAVIDPPQAERPAVSPLDAGLVALGVAPKASAAGGAGVSVGLEGMDPGTMDWAALEQAVSGCRACGLCETRTQTVFGVGNREADLLVIGEAPGAEEDRAGEPFVGRAGRLLNLMLAAIGLPRDQVYIANILKCRPPGNRDPKPDEGRTCEPYLLRQIALIRPRLILAVGRISAQTLLGTDESVGRLRGRWFSFGPGQTPLRVTYHPAYLLRSPDQKSKAWEDLTAVARRLDTTA